MRVFSDLGKVASKNYSWHVLTFNLHTYMDPVSKCPGVVTHLYIFTHIFQQMSATEAVLEGRVALRSTMLREVQSLVILLVVSCTYAVSYAANDEPCPTWFHRSQEGQCECGLSLQGIVSCDNATQRVGVLDCYCLTSNGDEDNTTVVGSCLFNCANQTQWLKDEIYHPVYWNVSELNDKTCGYLNRKGRLCSVCKDGYYVSAYSYDFTCFKCKSSVGYNVIKYVFIVFLPLTLLYFFFIAFRISATSPQLNSFVVWCQALTLPVYIRLIIQRTKNDDIFPLIQTLATVYGIWNLDFFRTVIPPICLPMNTMQILALEYVVALYPLLLIVTSYLLLMAYEREFRVVVWLWRPFHKCFVRFRRPWNLRYSIIDAFATFLLLSYMKLLATSVDLLIRVNVRNSYGILEGHYLYYDASIPFMGRDHIPYACGAVIIVIVVILLPLILLLLYPMQCFQRCLNRCGLNWQALRIFMESFQGCYRDRTDGGMECRYFAALYPSVRIMAFIMFGFLPNEIFSPVITAMLIGAAITIIVVQPYKDIFKLYNKVDAIMMLVLSMHCLSISFVNESQAKHQRGVSVTPGIIAIVITALTPLTYISIIIFRKLFPCQHTIRAFKQLKGLNLQAFRSKHQCKSVSIEPLEADDSTPLIKNR